LTKLGFSLLSEDKDFIIGLTVTTPTYGYLYKSANYEVNDLRKVSADSTSVYSNLNEAELNTYKTPLSIGYGIDFNYSRWRFSVSSEVFWNIDTYSIIETNGDPFEGYDLDGDFSRANSIQTGNKQIINISIGLQRKLLNQSTLIFGFRTDLNQRKKLEGIGEFEFLASTPSIYHFSAGGLFELWDNQVSVGFDYGYGRRGGNPNLIDFSNITSENLFTIVPGKDVYSTFNSIVLIVTYDFIFKRRRK